jgi:hypothetical protein
MEKDRIIFEHQLSCIYVLLYLRTFFQWFKTNTPSKDGLTEKKWVEKDMRGKGRGLILR